MLGGFGGTCCLHLQGKNILVCILMDIVKGRNVNGVPSDISNIDSIKGIFAEDR
jgi:hypothetical protein